jgi:hypothetical protein
VDLLGLSERFVCPVLQPAARRFEITMGFAHLSALVLDTLHRPIDTAGGLPAATTLDEILWKVILAEPPARDAPGRTSRLETKLGLRKALLGARENVLGQFDLAGVVRGACGDHCSSESVQMRAALSVDLLQPGGAEHGVARHHGQTSPAIAQTRPGVVDGQPEARSWPASASGSPRVLLRTGRIAGCWIGPRVAQRRHERGPPAMRRRSAARWSRLCQQHAVVRHWAPQGVVVVRVAGVAATDGSLSAAGFCGLFQQAPHVTNAVSAMPARCREVLELSLIRPAGYSSLPDPEEPGNLSGRQQIAVVLLPDPRFHMNDSTAMSDLTLSTVRLILSPPTMNIDAPGRGRRVRRKPAAA